jgi:ATP-dependent Clp protease ATP-binding subunit ClpA
MAERELQLELSEDAKDFLVEKGWDPAMGAARCAARSSASSRTRSPTRC